MLHQNSSLDTNLLIIVPCLIIFLSEFVILHLSCSVFPLPHTFLFSAFRALLLYWSSGREERPWQFPFGLMRHGRWGRKTGWQVNMLWLGGLASFLTWLYHTLPPFCLPPLEWRDSNLHRGDIRGWQLKHGVGACFQQWVTGQPLDRTLMSGLVHSRGSERAPA